MPRIGDFRRFSFRSDRIDRCGRHVGRHVYWKLYSIENTLRVVINSVLSQQLGANWWSLAVDPSVARTANRFRASYLARPQNASPGAHDLYLIFLSDLTEILRSNSHQFEPVIVDVNNWIARLEAIRVPRNLVGHMNFPNAFDRAAIETAYAQLPTLIGQLKSQGVPILVPA